MVIYDRLESYYDDYSPYIEYQINEFSNSKYKGCSHVTICPRCGSKEIIEVKAIDE